MSAPGDRRKVIVELTSKDLSAFNAVLGPMLQGLSELCSTFTPQQLNVIGDYLEGCVAVMRRTINDVRKHQVPAEPGS